jgi:hypothetical protein
MTAPTQNKVIIKGKGYPDADVHVLIDGKVIGIVKADTKADFYFESAQITPGVASFGIWSEDKDGIKSTLLTLTLRVTSGAVTTVTGAYLSPSINLEQKVVKRGEVLKIYGQTVPETEIQVAVHSNEEVLQKTSSTKTGEWSVNFNTTPLAEEDFHIAKALFQHSVDGVAVKSGYSRAISFFVSKGSGSTSGTKTTTGGVCAGADLNNDKRVNLTDFSIILFYWGTNNSCADQNKDGKVNLTDFSVMMYNWTG